MSRPALSPVRVDVLATMTFATMPVQAANADAALLLLGRRLDEAMAAESAAYERSADAEDDDDPRAIEADRLNDATGAIVDQIAQHKALTPVDLLVKLHAFSWCRHGSAPKRASLVAEIEQAKVVCDDSLLASVLLDVMDMNVRDPLDPDADLIAAAAEFCRLHDQLDGCEYGADPGSPAEDDAIAQQEHLLGKIVALAHLMADMVATTQAGLAARAVALGRYDPQHDFNLEAPGSIGRTLLDALLREGGALAGVPTPNPDAELLALRPEFDRLKAIYDDINDNPSKFATEELEEHCDHCCKEFDDMCSRLVAAAPARTAAGRAIKAEAALVLHGYVDDGGQAHVAISALLQELIDASPTVAQVAA